MAPRPLAPVAALALALVGAASGGACLGGGSLEARLEAPPVEMSARDSMKELRFIAEAETSDAVADGLVNVVVRSGDDVERAQPTAGQVRVTVGRGRALRDDPAPIDDVVPADGDGAVAIPKDALAGCEGSCRETFVVIFASEGLAPDATVSLPVVIEAQLVYENAVEAPPGDSLVLRLDD
jgi:hypothetical protein